MQLRSASAHNRQTPFARKMSLSTAASAAAAAAAAASAAVAAGAEAAAAAAAAASAAVAAGAEAVAAAAAPCSASSSLSAASSPPLTFTYHDHFLGKAMRIPIVNYLQIDSTLMLVKPALHFARSRAAAGNALHQTPPPLGCMQVALCPAQRARFMFGFTVKACGRASAVPTSSHVYLRTTSRWTACILQHVMAGYVCKVEVQLLLRNRARCFCCIDARCSKLGPIIGLDARL